MMEWNCTDIDRKLSDYLERLTTPEETAAFEAHLERCPDCAALVARVGVTVQMLRATEAVEVPSQLFRKIVNATSRATETERGWRKWMRPATIAWQPQFAMGAITIAASFLIVFHAANSSRGSQSMAALNPVNLVRTIDRQAHLTYAHTAKFVDNLRVVYEIQSRIEPDQGQDQETAPPSQQQSPGAAPQSPESSPSPQQQKSSSAPHSNRYRARTVLATATQNEIFLANTRSRS